MAMTINKPPIMPLTPNISFKRKREAMAPNKGSITKIMATWVAVVYFSATV